MGKTIAKRPRLRDRNGEPIHLQAIKARIRTHGDKAKLARALGIHSPTLDQIIQEVRNPTAKVLKGLGIRLVRVLEWETEPKGEPIGAASWVKPDIPAPKIDYPLTADRVQVAVRYGLNPGSEWACFIAATDRSRSADLDAEWLGWCAHCGTVPASGIGSTRYFAPLGNGDAVALKTPVARPDFRGEASIIEGSGGGFAMANFVPSTRARAPEVSTQAMAEAERQYQGGEDA